METLDGEPLWWTDRYIGCAHSGVRLADIDNDGRDEMVGITIIDDDGSMRQHFRFGVHFDSVFIYDVMSWMPGLEVIWTIDWTGEAKQLAAAKERHTSGDVAIFDPISGHFLHRFDEMADWLYVADVSGDWREELIVVNGNEIHVYHNEVSNPNSDHPHLWVQNHYRRSKMTWNYYIP